MNKKMRYLVWIVWVGVIFTFSLQPGSSSSETSGRIVKVVHSYLEALNVNVSHSDLSLLVRKGAHMFNFFILAWLSIFTQKGKKPTHRMLVALIAGITVASMDETIQTFIEGRSGSVQDVGIDTLGTLMTLMIYSINTRRKTL